MELKYAVCQIFALHGQLLTGVDNCKVARLTSPLLIFFSGEKVLFKLSHFIH